jgi:hypothetical protein
MEIIEILKYVIPSIIVLLTSYFTIWLFLNNENKRRLSEINLSSKDIIIPIRLQAYERIILFLERISPNSLIIRVHQQGMSATHFQSALLINIREEFEHNLSQQLYVSSPAWNAVKNAKEEIIKLINTSAARLSENESATSDDLSRKIFEMSLQMENLFTNIAIERIKKEIRQIFDFEGKL